jgi:hypothetical protein
MENVVKFTPVFPVSYPKKSPYVRTALLTIGAMDQLDMAGSIIFIVTVALLESGPCPTTRLLFSSVLLSSLDLCDTRVYEP